MRPLWERRRATAPALPWDVLFPDPAYALGRGLSYVLVRGRKQPALVPFPT